MESRPAAHADKWRWVSDTGGGGQRWKNDRDKEKRLDRGQGEESREGLGDGRKKGGKKGRGKENR